MQKCARIISHGGASCFEYYVLRQVCDTMSLHRYPESENLVVLQKWQCVLLLMWFIY